MALVEIRNLSFSYGNRRVLENISFKIHRGEIFCLFGPNGCGKSTLLECVLGTLKAPRGSIYLEGRDAGTLRPAETARRMAYVPQLHEKTFPYTVKEVVLMGRAAYVGMFTSPTEDDYAAAEDAMKKIGIQCLSGKLYTQLSGGELQLVMIARALAQETPVMLMDEPTAHLDFRHELIIMETVVQLVRETGMSILMATHFPNHAFYFSNNDIPTTVALMDSCRFAAVGRPEEVLSEKNMQRTFNVETRMVSYHREGDKIFRQIVALKTGGLR
ncbi:MAG: ABC transporter ATP-binding protein [Dethiobacteria bacterium]